MANLNLNEDHKFCKGDGLQLRRGRSGKRTISGANLSHAAAETAVFGERVRREPVDGKGRLALCTAESRGGTADRIQNTRLGGRPRHEHGERYNNTRRFQAGS